jgi:hypothetical protein
VKKCVRFLDWLIETMCECLCVGCKRESPVQTCFGIRGKSI